MSDHADRLAIAGALNTVDQIKAEPTFRQISRPGEALISWAGAFPSSNRFGLMNRWQVLIVLPTDLAAADAWAGDHLDAVLEALTPELNVTAINPTSIRLDTGSVPCLVIEGTRPRG